MDKSRVQAPPIHCTQTSSSTLGLRLQSRIDHMPHTFINARLDDGRGRGAAHAAGRVERIDAEELVDEAAGDAKHGRAAVLALGVQLELLDLGVDVPHPRVERKACLFLKALDTFLLFRQKPSRVPFLSATIFCLLDRTGALIDH